MLSGGLIMLAARQAVRLAFRRDGGLADPICECASFREKGGMPSRPDSCGHDPATASISDLHWKRPRYPFLGVLIKSKDKEVLYERNWAPRLASDYLCPYFPRIH